MSLPDFFFDRVTADIRQQMDGVVALAGQLARQRLTPDGEACAASIEEAAIGVSRMLGAAIDLKGIALRGVELELAPVRLRELMDEIEARWQPRAAAAGVTLLVAYDGDPDAAATMRETPVAASSMLATQAAPSGLRRCRASCPASARTPSIC